MPADVAGQTRAVGGLLNDSGDRVRCKRPIGDPATFPHGPEDRTAINIDKPTFESSDRTGGLIRTARNADLAAFGFLISFRTPKINDETLGLERQVTHFESREL
jgi:hypothetical protein